MKNSKFSPSQIIKILNAPEIKKGINFKKMKKLIYGGLLLAAVGIGIIGCDKSAENKNDIETRFSNFDELLKYVVNDTESKAKAEEDETMKYEIQWNKSNGDILITESKKDNIEFFLILEKAISSGSYSVDCCCDANGSLFWSKTCSGKFECGGIIADCLDIDSCAEICNATISVIPSTGSTEGFIDVAKY